MTFRLLFLLLFVVRLALPQARAEEPTTLWARAADGAEFYVAPSGDDQHPGSLDQPFRTLSRARDAVRAINQQDRQPGPIVVMGTSRMTRSVYTRSCPLLDWASPVVRIS